MLYNGLMVAAKTACDNIDSLILSKYKSAIILGAFLEDVDYIPGVDIIIQHHSFTHLTGRKLPGGYIPFLWPSPYWKAKKYFKKAKEQYNTNQKAKAFVSLGRVSHILSDMACPNHVNRVMHGILDHYEVYLETHYKEIEKLPIPEIPKNKSLKELIYGLAKFTQPFQVDRTSHPLGRFLKKRGILKTPTRKDFEKQTHAIIPMAIAYNIALFKMFLAEVDTNIFSK